MALTAAALKLARAMTLRRSRAAKSPATICELYLQAGARYGVDWAMLAGIGKVECDHGRDADPSCSARGGRQLGGRRRPDAVPRLDMGALRGGRRRRRSPRPLGPGGRDLRGCANYLRASGAPGDYRRAIFAYNHADWYVDDGADAGPRATADDARRRRPAPRWSGEANGDGWRTADCACRRRRPRRCGSIAGERATPRPRRRSRRADPGRGAGRRCRRCWSPATSCSSFPTDPAAIQTRAARSKRTAPARSTTCCTASGVRPIGEIVRDNPLAQDYVALGVAGPGPLGDDLRDDEPDARTSS